MLLYLGKEFLAYVGFHTSAVWWVEPDNCSFAFPFGGAAARLSVGELVLVSARRQRFLVCRLFPIFILSNSASVDAMLHSLLLMDRGTL